ncbi:hypothetical protein VNO78_27593 [Psophocarpus tetragonolobus]|uniref:t-SNARE coiled-coil homology domain-containing protein n=1 Tax=Psophocarpus tetragonolobus TaxID=3891 RepID=A0AAN9XBH1_PSOTE
MTAALGASAADEPPPLSTQLESPNHSRSPPPPKKGKQKKGRVVMKNVIRTRSNGNKLEEGLLLSLPPEEIQNPHLVAMNSSIEQECARLKEVESQVAALKRKDTPESAHELDTSIHSSNRSCNPSDNIAEVFVSDLVGLKTNVDDILILVPAQSGFAIEKHNFVVSIRVQYASIMRIEQLFGDFSMLTTQFGSTLLPNHSHNMPSAQDPFYVVKAEIQDSIDKLQSTFHQWKSNSDVAEQGRLVKEVLAGCESIEWQVDELDKAIAVASRDPSWYGIDEVEIENRRKWTSSARSQVGTMKKTVEAGKGSSNTSHASVNGMRQELMRLPNSHQTDTSNLYAARDSDDFIQSESDRQMLLIKEQDEELDELSESVRRIGGVGLTIHDELTAQEKILDELGSEMDSTTNRLDFVQKKVAMVMKKASAKGQIMMILGLLALFIFLFILVFFT